MSSYDENDEHSVRPKVSKKIDCVPNEGELPEDQTEQEVEGEDEIIGERTVDVPTKRRPVTPSAGEVEPITSPAMLHTVVGVRNASEAVDKTHRTWREQRKDPMSCR